jgi:mRNA-degrading endonuclease RelE of RelBE toxin-antitoxin system
MVHVIITKEAVKQIQALPTPIVARMERLVERLRLWPDVSGVKALRGELAGAYRMRTGDYRLQFHVRTSRKVIKTQKTLRGKVVTEGREIIETTIVVEGRAPRRLLR